MFTGNLTADVRRIFAQASQRARYGEQTEPEDATIVHRDVKPSNVGKRRIVVAKGDA